MARWFNIGGPCNPAQNYMLPAMGRLPDVASLLRKGQYFVVHAPRQCGKTTVFLSLANETNAKGDAVAIYCSLETVQGFSKAEDGIPKICACLRKDSWGIPGVDKFAEEHWPITDLPKEEVAALYAQHTAETGQVFEPEAIRHACVSSGGQPYLVNALAEGWLVVFDPDLTKPWDEKIALEDLSLNGKTVHLVRC